jgi:hypothetical protein
MLGDILLYIGSVVITLWGIAHIIPTQSVVKSFGSITEDNKKIITMEWITQGLTLCFIGLLVLLVTLFTVTANKVSVIVYRISAIMLVIMALVSALTGARTSVIPIKICPYVKTGVAILFFVGSIV